jgi:NADPH2:quinone reductase
MRQVVMDQHGPPEVLHVVEVPDPEPGPGQVLVRVAAAGVTFVETQVRAGRSPRPEPGPAELPAVLGNGVEGLVERVGEGADPSLVGRQVVTTTGGRGGYADLVVVDAGLLLPVPDGLGPGEAVALLADGRTALALAEAAAVQPGDRVAVTAAAGGLGGLLVQLALRAGADAVVGLASGADKLAVARELGATDAVDYRAHGWADAVRTAVGPRTVVFDGVGGDVGRALVELAAPKARYLIFGAASGAMTSAADVEAAGLTVIPLSAVGGGPEVMRGLSARAMDEAAAGHLRPTIGQRVPLADAAAAHAAIEARETIGKTILVP